jgi:hypothetical protein
VDRSEARRTAKLLFGNAHRLEIAAAIARAQTDIVTASTIATELAIPLNLVSEQLKSFVKAGVLADVPGVEGQRFRYFRRIDDPYWEATSNVLSRWSIRDDAHGLA